MQSTDVADGFDWMQRHAGPMCDVLIMMSLVEQSVQVHRLLDVQCTMQPVHSVSSKTGHTNMDKFTPPTINVIMYAASSS